jgi:hypothetical protein
MANVVTQPLKLGDQAGGLEGHGSQFAEGGPPEPVAGLGAAIQVAGCESGRPSEAVVEANLVLERAVAVDVLHDQRQSPGRELVPELFGQLTGEGTLGRFPETGPATRQEPVLKPAHGAQQDLLIAEDDRCHPEVERPRGRTPGDVASSHRTIPSASPAQPRHIRAITCPAGYLDGTPDRTETYQDRYQPPARRRRRGAMAIAFSPDGSIAVPPTAAAAGQILEIMPKG